MKKLLLSISFLVGMTIIMSVFFDLAIWFCLIFAGICVGVFLYLRRVDSQREQSKLLFYKKINYMEQLLCSYKRHGMMVLALKDCQYIFEGDETYGKILEETVKNLEDGEGRKSFVKIESVFPSRRMAMIHDFLCEMETFGGNVSNSVDILLKDIQRIRNQVFMLQHEKEQILKQHHMLMFAAGIICLSSKMMIPEMIWDEIKKSALYPVVLICVCAGFLFSYFLIYKKTKTLWREEENETNKRMKKKRDMTFWLMKITLYLPYMTSYQAIMETEKNSPEFQEEIHILLEELYEKPTSILPYLNFIHRVGLSEMQTDMRLLYAVQENGYPDMERQMISLVEHNYLVMEQLENERAKSELVPLSMIKQLPLLFAGIKILADMAWYVILMLEKYSFFL